MSLSYDARVSYENLVRDSQRPPIQDESEDSRKKKQHDMAKVKFASEPELKSQLDELEFALSEVNFNELSQDEEATDLIDLWNHLLQSNCQSSESLVKPHECILEECFATCCEMWLTEHPGGSLDDVLSQHRNELLIHYIRTKRGIGIRLMNTRRLRRPQPDFVAEMVHEFVSFVRGRMNGNAFVNFLVQVQFDGEESSNSPWGKQWSSYDFRCVGFDGWMQFFRSISDHRLKNPHICLIKANFSTQTFFCYWVTSADYSTTFLPDSTPNAREEFVLSETSKSLIWLCGTWDPSLEVCQAHLGLGGTRQRLLTGGPGVAYLMERFGYELSPPVREGLYAAIIELKKEDALQRCWEDFPKFNGPLPPRPPSPSMFPARRVSRPTESILSLAPHQQRLDILGDVLEHFHVDFHEAKSKMENLGDNVAGDHACMIDQIKLRMGWASEVTNMYRTRWEMKIRKYKHCLSLFPNMTSIMLMIADFMTFTHQDRIAGKSNVHFIFHTQMTTKDPDFHGTPIWQVFYELGWEFRDVGYLVDYGMSWRNFFNSVVADPSFDGPCICLVDFVRADESDVRLDIPYVPIRIHFVSEQESKDTLRTTRYGQFCLNDEISVTSQTDTDFMVLSAICPTQSPYEHLPEHRLPPRAYLGYGHRRTRLRDGEGLIRLLEKFSRNSHAMVEWRKDPVRRVRMDMSDFEGQLDFWRWFLGRE